MVVRFRLSVTYLNPNEGHIISATVSVIGLHPAFHAQGGDCSEAQFGSPEALHPRPQRKNLSLPRRLRFRPRRCPTRRTSPPVASYDEPPVGQAQGNVEKILELHRASSCRGLASDEAGGGQPVLDLAAGHLQAEMCEERFGPRQSDRTLLRKTGHSPGARVPS